MITDEVKVTLKRILRDKVLFDEPMLFHTSIGVGGKVDALVYPGTRQELRETILYLRDRGIPFMPLGNGTNVIVKDGGYRGVLISMKHLNSLTVREANGRKVSMYAEAGVSLPDFITHMVRDALSGLEFCAGIPGSVGGAVRMNAGAFGGEIKDVIETVTVMNEDGEVHEKARDSLTFEYRNLSLQRGAIILGTTFLLWRDSCDKIQKKVAEIVETRKKKHPLEYRSAGSVFKNPRGGMSAGEIIDSLGLKGTRSGNALISEKHGNFIVNLGGAKAKDIVDLIDLVQKRALNERGIILETEVKIIGED